MFTKKFTSNKECQELEYNLVVKMSQAGLEFSKNSKMLWNAHYTAEEIIKFDREKKEDRNYKIYWALMSICAIYGICFYLWLASVSFFSLPFLLILVPSFVLLIKSLLIVLDKKESSKHFDDVLDRIARCVSPEPSDQYIVNNSIYCDCTCGEPTCIYCKIIIEAKERIESKRIAAIEARKKSLEPVG